MGPPWWPAFLLGISSDGRIVWLKQPALLPCAAIGQCCLRPCKHGSSVMACFLVVNYLGQTDHAAAAAAAANKLAIKSHEFFVTAAGVSGYDGWMLTCFPSRQMAFANVMAAFVCICHLESGDSCLLACLLA
ncbi:hypothetical protein CBR_g17676 [Chara braunii]|uniref:Uncharacterized protein n=1 Tax=Chara braunii TaxID=69332 RepID=A0A388KV69_CHABU|nr:hypothetical protein CBR_g17676 [Chara braunii]|eukprot:GBG73964.1 hypothetical protein CBR_g17676 [Chara braunii]